MKIKQVLLIIFCAVCFLPTYSQSGKNNPEYRKFHLAIDAGPDYPLGTSNTVVGAEFDDPYKVPFASKDFAIGADAAYFFTKNYGVGLKYRFYTAKGKDNFLFGYIDTDNVYDYPIFGYHTSSFKEQTHFFGPAAYARWYLGGTQWSVPANIGIVYLYDKLSKLKRDIEYHYESSPPALRPSPPWGSRSTYGDLTGATVGVTFSVGVNYQIIPAVGIHVSVNGMFASMSKMNSTDDFDEPVTVDVSRKFNRIWFAAGLNYNF